MRKLLTSIFGTSNDRYLKSIQPLVDQINGLEDSIQKKSDEELRALTAEYKKRFQAGESLDDLLPEAFATVREAAKRTLGERHYDVQLIGGIVLHQGKLAEMKTGEGKTLVATLAAYLNALAGKGVHVVTVNDYLARRDGSWMAQVYNFLGLSCGFVIGGLDQEERKAAYNADITYVTNNELSFSKSLWEGGCRRTIPWPSSGTSSSARWRGPRRSWACVGVCSDSRTAWSCTPWRRGTRLRA